MDDLYKKSSIFLYKIVILIVDFLKKKSKIKKSKIGLTKLDREKRRE